MESQRNVAAFFMRNADVDGSNALRDLSPEPKLHGKSLQLERSWMIKNVGPRLFYAAHWPLRPGIKTCADEISIVQLSVSVIRPWNILRFLSALHHSTLVFSNPTLGCSFSDEVYFGIVVRFLPPG